MRRTFPHSIRLSIFHMALVTGISEEHCGDPHTSFRDTFVFLLHANRYAES
jgi:hypothetical protein